MNRLRVSNPLQEALRQTAGLENIGGRSGDWRFRGFCWDCGKDKPKAGGKLFGDVGRKSRGGPVRFKCADCLKKAEASA